MFSGFLNIRKPSGVSSFDAIKIVLREILAGRKPEKRVKIGHAGTLDPMATGLLVVFVGRATRAASFAEESRSAQTSSSRVSCSFSKR